MRGLSSLAADHSWQWTTVPMVRSNSWLDVTSAGHRVPPLWIVGCSLSSVDHTQHARALQALLDQPFARRESAPVAARATTRHQRIRLARPRIGELALDVDGEAAERCDGAQKER
jgi:hypothetical protein